MSAGKIRVIIKHPDRVPYCTNISANLRNLQKIVGGKVESVTLEMFKHQQRVPVVCLCNEEGLLEHLPYNCNINGVDFVGSVIFCGAKGDELADIPMSFQQFKAANVELWEVWPE